MKFIERKEYYGNLLDEVTNNSYGEALVLIDFENEIATEASIYLIKKSENKFLLLETNINWGELILKTEGQDLYLNLLNHKYTSKSDIPELELIQGKIGELFFISDVSYENFDNIHENQTEAIVVLDEINFLENDLLLFKNDVIKNLRERKKTISAYEYKFKNILNECIFFPWISSTNSNNNYEIILTMYYNFKFKFDSSLAGKYLLEEVKNKTDLILRLFNLLTRQVCDYNFITIKYFEGDKKRRIEYSKKLDPIKKHIQRLTITKEQYLLIIDETYQKVITLSDIDLKLFKVISWRLIKARMETDLSIRIALYHTIMIQLLKYLLKDKGYNDFINNEPNIRKVFSDLDLPFNENDIDLIFKFNQIRNKTFKNISMDNEYDCEFNDILNHATDVICKLLIKFFELVGEPADNFRQIFENVHSINLKVL
jgi:hypothetical protein